MNTPRYNHSELIALVRRERADLMADLLVFRSKLREVQARLAVIEDRLRELDKADDLLAGDP